MQIPEAVIRAALTFAITLPCLGEGVAQAQQPIVGKWAIGSRCAVPLSTIVIEPMALTGEDFYCRFGTVMRRGDTVRWNGKCNFSENGYEFSTVTAQLRDRKLFYRFSGMGWNGPFDRCR